MAQIGQKVFVTNQAAGNSAVSSAPLTGTASSFMAKTGAGSFVSATITNLVNGTRYLLLVDRATALATAGTTTALLAPPIAIPAGVTVIFSPVNPLKFSLGLNVCLAQAPITNGTTSWKHTDCADGDLGYKIDYQ